MNRLAKILPLENVVVGLSVTSKKRVFEQAGLIFENQNGIARSTVTDNLFARERLGSTRRVVLPLLDRLDRAGLTRRLPDDRREVVG